MTDEEKKEDNADKDVQSALNGADKKSFDTAERLGLNINTNKATEYQAERGKIKISELSPLQRQLHKKARIATDEEDSEMDEDVIRSLRDLQASMANASNGDTSLLQALNPEERSQINQKSTIEISRHEDNAGKLNAMLQSDTLSRRAGITEMKTAEYANNMQNAIYNPRRLRRETFERNVAAKVGLKGHIKRRTTGKVVIGVKKIVDVGKKRKVKGMTMRDAETIGKKHMSNNATAEMILRKSGQTVRLAEIKMKREIKSDGKEVKKPNRSYATEMRKLLQDSLRRNAKVH